MVKNVLN